MEFEIQEVGKNAEKLKELISDSAKFLFEKSEKGVLVKVFSKENSHGVMLHLESYQNPEKILGGGIWIKHKDSNNCRVIFSSGDLLEMIGRDSPTEEQLADLGFASAEELLAAFRRKLEKVYLPKP